MSNEFWSNLNEKKKKEILEKMSQTKASSASSEGLETDDFWSALNEVKKQDILSKMTANNVSAPMRTFTQDDDDIAPVKGGNKNSIFKSGGFSDGVDGVGDFFGDLGQTVLGTAADLGLGILKGAGRLVEGVTDLGTYGVAGIADLLGADKFADNTKKLARYNVTDKLTKGAVDYVDQYSVLGNKADVVSEGLGQVGAIIATGGLAGAAGLGSVGATALTTGVTFASGMGSGMNEAYEGGASDGAAIAYGATSGAVEAISELIFGGLGKGVKALGVSKGLTSIDDVFAKKLSNAAAKYITSEAGQKIVGNTLEYAVKSGAEGLEEVISGFGSAIAKDVYLLNDEDEKAFWDIVDDENLLEQFVVGSITSAIAQGGDFIKSTKNGRDFVTGLSKNEQTVVDKVYEQRLAEESENRTLSNRDKNKLYERVVEEMKKGYISTDEIESILGGKTYEGYKSLTEKQKSLEERKTAIENEIKDLVKTPESQFTVEQREKLTSLREEAKGIKDELQNLGIKTAKNNLFNEVNKLTSKDTYLRESYNDLIRQTQDIQIDENRYNGTKFADAAKKTIENARKAGASNSIKVRDFVEFSAKYSSVSGTVVDFKDANQINKILEDQLNAQITKLSKSTTAEDKAKLAEIQDMLKQVQEGKIHVNGVKTKDGVAINIKSPNYLNVVLGHEVTHFLEGKKAYEALQKAAFKYAQTKGDYEGRREVLEVLYDGIDGTSVDYELTADLVGDYLFTDYDFIKSLSTENRNVFQKVYDQIKYMFKLATAGSKEARELEKVMHQFEKVLRESVGTKNTITEDGVQYALADIKKVTPSKEQTSSNIQEVAKMSPVHTVDESKFLVSGKSFKEIYGEYFAEWGENIYSEELGDISAKSSSIRSEIRHGSTTEKIAAIEAIPSVIKNGKIVDWIEKNPGSYRIVVAAPISIGDTPYIMGVMLQRDSQYQRLYIHDVVIEKETSSPSQDDLITTGSHAENDSLFLTSILQKIISVKNNFQKNEKNSTDPEDAFFDGEKKQFSLSTDKKKADADYKFAVENGDTETAQKMVDEAAKNAGYGIKAYHGTGYDFTVFDKSKQGDNYQDWGRLGKGFYFAPTSREAETWAELSKGGKNKVMPVYLRSDNMLDSFEALPDDLKDTIPENWEGLTRRLAEKYAYNYIEYMQEFGYNVQQILTEKGYDGINGHTEFVVFDPEQVKSADAITYDDDGNVIPLSERFNTENEDIRFSLSRSVEESKNLFAVHNLKSDELIKTLELGGLPMPSIAVIKAEQGHEQYGDVSLIFPKDTIDPQANKDNKVYGGDAWTPTYPRIEYKPNDAVAQKIRDKYYGLAHNIGYDEVRPLYNYVNDLENTLNRDGGEAPMLEKLYDDTGMMNVYLQDIGKGKVETITKENVTKISDAEAEMNKFFIDVLGEDFIAGFKAPEGVRQLTHSSAYLDQHDAEIREAYKRYFMEVHGFTQEEVSNALTSITKTDLMKIMLGVHKFTQNNGVTVRTETDYEATEKAIREAASDGYKEWIDGLFRGIEEKSGIRNNQDYYTRSGNPRSWDALHWENTLENVVKVMKGQDETGVGSFSPFNTLFGASHKQYSDIQEIKADSDRLGKINQEEYDAMKDSFSERFFAVAESIKDPYERNPFIAIDTAAEQIIEAIRTKKTKTGILNHLRSMNSSATMQTVDDVLSLVSDIANMPTGYFEAKPQRAVGLEEVGVFVIPNNVDVKLKQELLNKGYSIAEYDPNVEGDRQRVVNQFEEYKFSLSDVGDKRTLGGSYRFDGKDFRVKTEQDIAPIIGISPTTSTSGKTVGEVAPTEQTVDKKITEKLKNLQTELENNKGLRDESNADFDSEIARLQAEYDAKKDKNTKVANDLLRRIEKKKRLKADVNAKYESKIESLSERVQKMQTPQYRRGEQRRAKQEQFANEIRNLIGDTSTWKDKRLGISYQTNTLHRNLRYVVRDANGNQDIAKADEIYEYLQGSYNHNEAQLKRESREIKQKYADMKINKYESVYIQMLGEFNYNPDTKLTIETVEEYFNEHKDSIDIDKVKKAIEESRKDYDNLLKRVNAVLREQGLKEIGYREGYFPHFTDTKQSWLAKLFNWKTIDTEIPTDIAGLTEDFNPVRTYQSYDKHRKTDETDYNFLKGFDTYVHGALDWIYHIEDIQKRRAFENEIRYVHSEQGIRDKIDGIRKKEDLDADEVQKEIDAAYAEARNPLNNFVTDLRNSTNNLAGKKSTADREMEYATNRKIYSTMTNISNRVSGNMVVGSISSALTNIIPITQSWGQVNPVSSLVAMGDTIRNAYRDDGMIKKSDFMTNRLLNEENLNQTGWDKASNVAGGLMNIFDHFSTEVIWRSKFRENMNKGMSEAEAIHDADIFAENVMAGRSRGNMPTIYNSKNPITKMLTAFQLEVANQYGYMFKDMPQDIGKENVGKLTAGYAKMFIGAYLYNALFSALTGRDAALDPIGILEDLMKDLGFGGDDEEEEVDVMGALSGLGENIAQEIPYIGGLLGGGRVPISSALPYNSVTEMVTGTMEDMADNDKANLAKEWLKPFYYLAMPFGGGQLKKTIEGLSMFNTDEEHPIAGSYTTSGNLRFPVEDTFGNRVQAALFGQYASKNAREYFDNGYAPLKEKQIEEYMDVDLPIADYWKYREGLSGLKTNAEKADYINSLNIENWQKNLLLNNILDRKEDVDMSNYDDYSDWEEFDYAQKNPDKYAFAKSVGGYSSYKTYSDALYDIKADKDENGKSINGSRKEKVINYINNLDADYETKIILFKSEYPSDDTYNMEIINYINNRTDLTYEERVAIFTELGFTVSNGSVYWD